MNQKIVVFTGAGISAESGLGTFRDTGGIWEQFRIEDVCTAEAWQHHPERCVEFYNMRRRDALAAMPNAAHEAIARLQQVFPSTQVITQNIDNLHERAGSTQVIHLHGELTKVTSSRNRQSPRCIKEYPLDVPIRLGDKAEDGSQLRPYIVWFGEYVSGMEVAEKHVREADIFAVIGTSLQVYPAAGLTRYAHGGVPKFVVDPHLEVIPTGFTHIRENATSGVARLVEEIKRL